MNGVGKEFAVGRCLIRIFEGVAICEEVAIFCLFLGEAAHVLSGGGLCFYHHKLS